MPRLGTMNYRGTEVWLEDNHGRRLSLAEDPQINENLQTVSASVHLDPKTLFTLVWRRETSAKPMSALCQVFISGGYLTPDTATFCVATVPMDKEKRKTQRRTTWGHQNAPYKRKCYLRTGRRCDLPKRKAHHTVGCSLRLEIRRIRGHVHQPQWIIGPDHLEVRESNAHKMDIIDDEEMDMLPFATFPFHFPEIDVEQREHEVGGQDTVSKGDTAGIEKISALQNFTDNVSSRWQSEQDDSGRNNGSKKRRTSGDGEVISTPDHNETVYVNTNASQRVTDPKPKKVFRKVEVVIPVRGSSINERRREAKKDDPIKIEEIEGEHVKQQPSNREHPCQSELTEDYLALDKIEKELKRKLKEKIKAKQNNIHYLRHLLESD